MLKAVFLLCVVAASAGCVQAAGKPAVSIFSPQYEHLVENKYVGVADPRARMKYRVSSDYKSKGYWRRGQHAGMDFRAGKGDPILAVSDGKVARFFNYFDGCGTGVALWHPAIKKYSVYCHMQDVVVSGGQKVKRGDILGHVGMTGNTRGPHVHLEISTDGESHADGDTANTRDPKNWDIQCILHQSEIPTNVIVAPILC